MLWFFGKIVSQIGTMVHGAIVLGAHFNESGRRIFVQVLEVRYRFAGTRIS